MPENGLEDLLSGIPQLQLEQDLLADIPLVATETVDPIAPELVSIPLLKPSVAEPSSVLVTDELADESLNTEIEKVMFDESRFGKKLKQAAFDSADSQNAFAQTEEPVVETKTNQELRRDLIANASGFVPEIQAEAPEQITDASAAKAYVDYKFTQIADESVSQDDFEERVLNFGGSIHGQHLPNFFKAGANESITGKVSEFVFGDELFDMRAYDPNVGEEVAAGIVSMIMMPLDVATFSLGGGLGGILSNTVKQLTSKGIPLAIANKTALRGASKAIQRYISYGQMTQAGTGFAAYEGLNNTLDQLKQMEVGDVKFDFHQLGEVTAKGFGKGALMSSFGKASERLYGGKPSLTGVDTKQQELASLAGEVAGLSIAAPILLEGRMPTLEDIGSTIGMIGGIKLGNKLKRSVSPSDAEKSIVQMERRAKEIRNELGVDFETSLQILGHQIKQDNASLGLKSTSQQAFDSYVEFDGSSFHPAMGNLAKTSSAEGRPVYSVSLWPDRTKVIDGKNATKEDFDKFIEDNKDVLGSSDRNLMGSWYDAKDTKNTFLDIATITHDAGIASKLGERYNQISMMRLTDLKEYKTGGNGKKVVPRDAASPQDRHLEVEVAEANKVTLPITSVEMYHYSADEFKTLSGFAAKEAGTLGRTGGAETNRDGPPAMHFYGKGSNVELVHGLGNKSDFVHKFNGTLRIYDGKTASDVEKKNYGDKKREISKRDRIFEQGELTDNALREIGYDGFVVGGEGNAVYKMFTPIEVLSNRISETAKKAGDGYAAAEKAEMNADFIPHLDSGFAPLQTRAHNEIIANERMRASEVAVANNQAREWIEKLSDQQLNDIGASVEGIGNLAVGGDTNAAVQGRMTPEMEKVKEDYQLKSEKARRSINDHLREYQYEGEDYIQYIEDYLLHSYVGSAKKIKVATHRFMTNSPNAKKRILPTLKDAKNAGLVPLTQNIATLHSMWNEMNWKVASNVKTMNELNSMISDEGTPVMMNPEDAPSTWPIVNSPLFRKLGARKSGGKTILYEKGAAIHPDIAPIVEKLTQQPFDGKFVKILEGVNRWSKKASLSFSGFHYLSLAESASATLLRGRNPLRGMFVVGEKDPTTGKRVITQPHRIGARLMKQDEFLRDAIGHGLQIQALSDAQVSRTGKDLLAIEALTTSPLGKTLARGVRKFNTAWDKALWDNYHAGLKSFTYYDLVGELSNKFPEYDKDLLKEQIASHVNDAYGGQETVNLLRATPRIEQLARISLLAPDYTLSNLRVASRALTADTPAGRKLGARYWRNMVPTLAIGPAAAQMAIYTAFGDDEKGDSPYIWDNESGREWDIDITPIMRKFSDDPEDQQRSYTHLGKQARELFGWGKDWVGTLYGKSSPVVQIGVEQFLGVNGPTGFEEEFAKIDFWERFPENAASEVKMRAAAVGEKYVPFSWRGNNFAMTAPMSRGISEYQTVKGLEKVLDLYANPTRFSESKNPNFEESLKNIAPDIIDAASRNGWDVEQLLSQAISNKRSFYYARFHAALEDENATKEQGKFAKAIIRMHGGYASIVRSMTARGIDFETSPEALEAMNRAYELAVEEVDPR